MIRTAALLAMAATAAVAQTTPSGPPAAAPRKPAVAAALPNYRELKYPALRPIVPPAIDSVTLPNGMRLFLLENHELPLINGTVLVRTGSAFDPPDKIGLAQIAGQVMLDGDTTNRPGDDLTRRFQDLGAEIDTRVTENILSVAFLALKENADAALDALKDGLTAPAFPEDRLDLAKVRMRNSIAHRNDNGVAILRREFAATVYGKSSPYGAQVEYADLDRINRADLVGFHQRYFFPKNVMLALEGDFDPAALKGRIEALFDDWKSDQPAAPEFPKVSEGRAPGTFLAVKKDTAKSFFTVGQVGGDYLDKDFPALQIMADILGGGPQGRLNQRMPAGVERVGATWAPGFGYPGLFQVSGSMGNPFVTTEALRIVFEELNKIRSAEVSQEELKTAKAAALNSTVFGFDNQLSILPRLTEYQYFGFPGDYTQQYEKAIEGVSRADVLRVAKERLDPAKMTTVVVGNPTAFETPLDALGGPVVPIDLTIPPPKAEASLGEAASQRRGKQILARAQQAMGGADKLTAVTDYVEEMAYQFDAAAGGAQGAMTERWIAPGYLRQDNTNPAGKVSVYSDGKTGWVANAQSSGVLAGVPLKQVQSDLFRTLFSLLTSDRAPNRKIIALEDNAVEISDGDGQIAGLVFDSATGRLKTVTYDAPTASGLAPVIHAYSDYRDVGGLKLPFKDAVMLSGKKYEEVNVKNIQLNTGLKVQDLEKRP